MYKKPLYKLKPLFRNINSLNIILILVIIILTKNIIPLTMKIDIKYIPTEVKKPLNNNKDKVPQEFHIPSLSDYTMVAEENLFHPERKIPEEKKEEQPLPKPEFVLYGTLITDDLSLAFLEDLKAPLITPGRGKRQTVLKKGDVMSNFTLEAIQKDKIVMARGDEKMTVYLSDLKHPKTRDELSQPSPIKSQKKVPSVSKPPSVSLPQRQSPTRPVGEGARKLVETIERLGL